MAPVSFNKALAASLTLHAAQVCDAQVVATPTYAPVNWDLVASSAATSAAAVASGSASNETAASLAQQLQLVLRNMRQRDNLDLLNVITAQLTARGLGNLTAGLSVGSNTMTAVADVVNFAAGILTLAVSNTVAFEGNAAVQDGLQDAIATGAGVFPGDVSIVSLVTPGIPPVTSTARRLTPGSVTVNYHIAVPGLAAQGFHGDCSMAKVSFAAIDSDGVTTESTWAACQTRCANNPICEIWSYEHWDQDCTLSYADSAPTYKQSSYMTAHFKDDCGVCPPATILSTAGWPGTTAEASQQAFGGQQPMNLQCWPKNHNFGLMRCDVTTLQDVNGPAEWFGGATWPGRCNQLSAANPAQGTALSCEVACTSDPYCSVFQFDQEDNTCWLGQGYDCQSGAGRHPTAWRSVASKRIQHGSVRVIANATGFEVQNLQLAFGNNYYGTAPSADEAAVAVETCRKVCYSDILCQYWQFYVSSGCWVEAPATKPGYVPYPLVQGVAGSANVGALTVGTSADTEQGDLIAGEFIVHYCEAPTTPLAVLATTPAPTMAPVQVTPAPESGPSPLVIILGCLLAACLLGACLFLACRSQKKPIKAKTRAVKPTKAKAPPPPPPVELPQPVMTVRAQPQMLSMVRPSIAPTYMQARGGTMMAPMATAQTMQLPQGQYPFARP